MARSRLARASTRLSTTPSFQHILTVRARGVGRRCNTAAVALSRQGDHRLEKRRIVHQRTVEVEDHCVVVAGVDGDW